MRFGVAEVGIFLVSDVRLHRMRADASKVAQPLRVDVAKARSDGRAGQLLTQLLEADGHCVLRRYAYFVVPDELPVARAGVIGEKPVAQVRALVGPFGDAQATFPALEKARLPPALRGAEVLRRFMNCPRVVRRKGVVVAEATLRPVDRCTNL